MGMRALQQLTRSAYFKQIALKENQHSQTFLQNIHALTPEHIKNQQAFNQYATTLSKEIDTLLEPYKIRIVHIPLTINCQTQPFIKTLADYLTDPISFDLMEEDVCILPSTGLSMNESSLNGLIERKDLRCPATRTAFKDRAEWLRNNRLHALLVMIHQAINEEWPEALLCDALQKKIAELGDTYTDDYVPNIHYRNVCEIVSAYHAYFHVLGEIKNAIPICFQIAPAHLTAVNVRGTTTQIVCDNKETMLTILTCLQKAGSPATQNQTERSQSFFASLFSNQPYVVSIAQPPNQVLQGLIEHSPALQCHYVISEKCNVKAEQIKFVASHLGRRGPATKIICHDQKTMAKIIQHLQASGLTVMQDKTWQPRGAPNPEPFVVSVLMDLQNFLDTINPPPSAPSATRGGV